MPANVWSPVCLFGESLGPAVNIVTVLFWIWGVFSIIRGLFRRVWRKRLLRLAISGSTVALAIGIGGKLNPIPAAKEYIQTNCPGVPLINLHNRQGFLSPDEVIQAIEDIRDKVAEFMSAGGYISKVLLFYAGPNTVALSVGALFANWVPVQVFQFDEGRYIYQYTLNRELLKNVRDGRAHK